MTSLETSLITIQQDNLTIIFSKPYSEETAKVIDTEISKLIEEQLRQSDSSFETNKEKVNSIS